MIQRGDRVAVVGTGISGLVSAYLLRDDYDITVYEANSYIGGHTNTIKVEAGEASYAVDTGFIVFNEPAYPNFTKLLNQLGVASRSSEMSFSVRCDESGLEYNGTSLNKLFAQRRNMFRPSFYRMLKDIMRFYRESRELLVEDPPSVTLGDYLHQNGYSRIFVDQHMLPMGAAIWSASEEDMLEFPAYYFVRFFDHHGFLNLSDRPDWRTVKGGSYRYVQALTSSFAYRIRLNTPVKSIRRFADHVEIIDGNGHCESFDHVVIASHSDQVLAMLERPTETEREVLGAIGYRSNEIVFHTDESVLPKNRLAWASWNYHLPKVRSNRPTVSYNLNILQGLDAPVTFIVSLNSEEPIDDSKVIRRINYHHPQYTTATLDAQARHAEISGANRTHYCGAYWGYGFHEDGVNSALAAVVPFGKGF